MPDPRNFRLRVTFCKQGRLALLSHLEVARALERAVRRAGLPFAVSEGFSPHMKIAFGAALPVGVGGTRELFDLQMTRYVRPEEALAALQAASVPDLMVKACSYIDAHAPAASAAYPVGTYRALLSCAPAALPVPEEVRVVRKKKEKVLHVPEFLAGEMELAGATLTLSLVSKPTGSLRPDVLLAACCAEANAEAQPDGGSENPLAFLVENTDPTLIDADACTERNPLRVLTITRIDQRPA
ncbi:TIGR03936 family radical SAM-associated protein [Arabiibacter massiliensis]|uniref:TIGR03936 family radical SAM-associated protein n=1 Tax=Arabiibacter massiliensis TaxID=1870985 RepID=UPI0009BBBF6C|nr:TIGR03936 family radical SAM-associated protein [Arabiibacter massiliensis]